MRLCGQGRVLHPAYYFYYTEDIVGGHPHDLEAAEFEVRLEQDASCRRARLVSVRRSRTAAAGIRTP
jgi:hypothetical protein